MKLKERITHIAGDKDGWVCLCRNTPTSEGFYPCEQSGNEVEPLPGWVGVGYTSVIAAEGSLTARRSKLWEESLKIEIIE
jgi:hypothetical protein